jgi:hypothetical protein
MRLLVCKAQNHIAGPTSDEGLGSHIGYTFDRRVCGSLSAYHTLGVSWVD